MRCTVLRVVLLIVGLQHADLLAQEIQLRAGTLLDCTLQEPSFSSHSAKVGEPLNCQARPLGQFGRVAIPHGAFFVGRFESYRDPGRVLGKGWIKLEFDRLIVNGHKLCRKSYRKGKWLGAFGDVAKATQGIYKNVELNHDKAHWSSNLGALYVEKQETRGRKGPLCDPEG